jgi:hypothetical protein
MTKPRYKDRHTQRVYDTLLALAADKTSELYYNGEPRRGGASHRAAFWDGYSGKYTLSRCTSAIPGTMSAVCFMAGKEHARREKQKKA